jgi:hypothetical protein
LYDDLSFVTFCLRARQWFWLSSSEVLLMIGVQVLIGVSDEVPLKALPFGLSHPWLAFQ